MMYTSHSSSRGTIDNEPYERPGTLVQDPNRCICPSLSRAQGTACPSYTPPGPVMFWGLAPACTSGVSLHDPVQEPLEAPAPLTCIFTAQDRAVWPTRRI